MNHQPRFQAEYLIQQHVGELRSYADVFNTRIAGAFDELQTEAERIQEDEYARLAASGAGPDDDESVIAEEAYFKGVSFYIATDAVRQGIVNLMVAGLFHLFEQQVGSLAREMDTPARLTSTAYPWEKLKQVLRNKGVDVSRFTSFG